MYPGGQSWQNDLSNKVLHHRLNTTKLPANLDQTPCDKWFAWYENHSYKSKHTCTKTWHIKKQCSYSTTFTNCNVAQKHGPGWICTKKMRWEWELFSKQVTPSCIGYDRTTKGWIATEEASFNGRQVLEVKNPLWKAFLRYSAQYLRWKGSLQATQNHQHQALELGQQRHGRQN